METTQQIKKVTSFLQKHYHAELLEQIRKGDKFLQIDFGKFVAFNPELADLLLDKPDDMLKVGELAVAEFDVEGDVKGFVLRFSNLPESQKIMVREIRSHHIGKFISTIGVVRQKSDVRPQVTASRFECPSCGNIIPVLQLDKKLKEPTRCGCGRKGKFRLLSKDLVDAQGLVLEEAPEELEGGEQPKRMNIFLTNDLVSPISEKKTNPGSKVTLNGIIKEVPIILKSGGQSTRFDLLIEANFIEPIEDDLGDLAISDEEMEEITQLSTDPKLYQKLVSSIAPSVYGHSEIKEALVLQLMGGVRKVRDEGSGSITRGDMHVLLVGDPGSGKSQLLKRLNIVAPKSRYVSGKGVTGAGLCVAPDSMVMTNPGGMETIRHVVEDRMEVGREFCPGVWKQDNVDDVKIQSLSSDFKLHSMHPESIWKLKAPSHVYEITLSSGKKIELTANTKLFLCSEGKTFWKKSKDLKIGEFIGTPRKLVSGTNEKICSIDLFSSNPVVHNIKSFVKSLSKKLSKKYGTLRQAAKELGVPENSLYHHWVKQGARGNVKLNTLKKLAESVGEKWKEHVREVSLYNGKNHALPVYLSEDVLYLAGLIAGDGDIRQNNDTISVRLSNSSALLQEAFSSILDKEFGLSCDIQKGSLARPESRRTHSKILGEILLSLGIPFSPKSHRLRISNILLHMSNSMLAAYVSGLFDADGCVYVRPSRRSGHIEFTTCSEELARQLQLVFLRYEIHACLRKRKVSLGIIKERHDKWVLTIRDLDQIKLFARNFSLRHPEKQKSLRHLSSLQTKLNTNIDVIPGVSSFLKKELQKYGLPLKKVGYHYMTGISRKKLQCILGNVSVKSKVFDGLHQLAHSDIFWEKIVECKRKKTTYKYVYDLTVEDSHNFVVDGVLVHNTASVVKDEFLQGWSLEAGALVLANRGQLMIDELDKMGAEDRSSLHEGLEQQTISIAKANIQATLRCETTVLAAANPKFGRFDPYSTVAEQIDLPPTLINRFDLIFPIKDLPDAKKDDKMASFILALHQNPDIEESDIATPLLRKYFAYAKQNFSPVLTDGATQEIKDYYLKMRASGNTESGIKSIPISARQLEGLVRLSEAVAKCRLSNKVTKKDAKRAVSLLNFSLRNIAFDEETGTIDIDRIATDMPASQRSKIVSIRDLITELEGRVGKNIPMEEIVRAATEKGLSESEVDEAIEKLKRTGSVFEPRPGTISRI